MKYFCSKCGKTTQYSFDLPKFCAFCGQSFASNTVSKPTPKTERFLNELKLKKNVNNYEEESYGEDEIPNIDFKKVKASFKLDLYQPKGESFGSLIDNPSQQVEFVQENIPGEKKTKEQILKEFQKEAGLSRNQE
jgi:hypothetical protein